MGRAPGVGGGRSALIPRLRSGAYLALTGRIRPLPTVRRSALLSTKPDETDDGGPAGGDSNTVEGNLIRVQVPAPVPRFERDTVPGARPGCPAATQPFPGLRRHVAAGLRDIHAKSLPDGPPTAGHSALCERAGNRRCFRQRLCCPSPQGCGGVFHVRPGLARYSHGAGDGLSAPPLPRRRPTEPSARRAGVRFRPPLPDCGHPKEIP